MLNSNITIITTGVNNMVSESFAYSSNSNFLLNAIVAAFYDPKLTIILGAIITSISGTIFAWILQIKLTKRKNELIPVLPLNGLKTYFSWTGSFAGITLVFTGTLQAYDFSGIKSLIVSLLISFISGLMMWKVLNDLMLEIDKGEVKEIDEYY